MPSKIASEKPFSLLRLVGWWAATVLLAYAVGWAHIGWSSISPPPQHAPTITAPAQH